MIPNVSNYTSGVGTRLCLSAWVCVFKRPDRHAYPCPGLCLFKNGAAEVDSAVAAAGEVTAQGSANEWTMEVRPLRHGSLCSAFMDDSVQSGTHLPKISAVYKLYARNSAGKPCAVFIRVQILMDLDNVCATVSTSDYLDAGDCTQLFLIRKHAKCEPLLVFHILSWL